MVSRSSNRRLPWWLSGKESTCQCRAHGFNPWSRKIPQASEQLLLKPELPNKTTTREQPVLSTTREKACAAMKTQHSHKLMNYLKKKKKTEEETSLPISRSKEKRKKIYYYLPTSIDCTPIFYSKKKQQNKSPHCTVHT